MNQVTIPLRVSTDGDYTVEVSGGGNVNLGMDTTVTAAILEHYDGPYTVEPGSGPQTLNTLGKVMDYNVVVSAVPQQYGLITWNGSTLTVS